MSYFILSEGGFKTPAFEVTIKLPSQSAFSSGLQFLIGQREADSQCLKLSAAFPEATIELERGARIKAIYQNGKRTRLNDFRNFYSDMSEEEYAQYCIQDAKSAEMV